MSDKDELLEEYDGANQGTKREIIKYLWRFPDAEHKPEEIFSEIQDDCRANTIGTVERNLSELAEESQINQQTRSYYEWDGSGRPRPNSRLQEVGYSLKRWIASLGVSYGVLLFLFLIWMSGFSLSFVSLIALFSPGNTFLGISFIGWFVGAGTLMLIGSAVVMIWIPIYLIDVLAGKRI